MATWIIGGIVLGLMALAALYTFRKIKNGGCAGCANTACRKNAAFNADLGRSVCTGCCVNAANFIGGPGSPDSSADGSDIVPAAAKR